MKSVLIIIVCCAVSGASAQSFATWCPTLGSDITTCAATLTSSISSLFTDVSTVLGTTTLFSDTLSTICSPSYLNIVKTFYSCVYGKLLTCVPTEWHKAMATTEQVLASIDYLCQNIDNIDLNCVPETARFNQLTTCTTQQLQGQTFDTSTPDGLLLFTCRFTDVFMTCAPEAYRNCSKVTTGSVLAQYTQYQKPAACRACITLSSSMLILTLLVLVYQYLF